MSDGRELYCYSRLLHSAGTLPDMELRKKFPVVLLITIAVGIQGGEASGCRFRYSTGPEKDALSSVINIKQLTCILEVSDDTG